jgi:very-short-patch-repair endonuclease
MMGVSFSDLPKHVRAQIDPPAKKAKRARAKTGGGGMSALEETFAFQLRCQGDHFPKAEREYRFHPGRDWRFDFAWPRHMVAVEVEGGVRMIGRHQRPEGFVRDLEKYNEAALLGWLVLRVADTHLESMRALAWLERALHPSRAHRGVGE